MRLSCFSSSCCYHHQRTHTFITQLSSDVKRTWHFFCAAQSSPIVDFAEFNRLYEEYVLQRSWTFLVADRYRQKMYWYCDNVPAPAASISLSLPESAALPVMELPSPVATPVETPVAPVHTPVEIAATPKPAVLHIPPSPQTMIETTPDVNDACQKSVVLINPADALPSLPENVVVVQVDKTQTVPDSQGGWFTWLRSFIY